MLAGDVDIDIYAPTSWNLSRAKPVSICWHLLASALTSVGIDTSEETSFSMLAYH